MLPSARPFPRIARPLRHPLWRGLLIAAVCAGGLAFPRAGVAGEAGVIFDPRTPPAEAVALAIPKGQVDAAIAKLNDFTTALMKRSGVPGLAVAVVRDGKTVYLKGFGVRKIGDPAPVDADTVFQLASLSKAVGASVVAHQVGKGVIGWDTPVTRHLPWFALNDPWVSTHLTIADLYAHRSGLPEHAGDELELLGFDRRQILERLKLLPLAPFRITYAYTNFGVTAAAEAVATASGKTWADLSQEVLYTPLGMSGTSSTFADFIARPNRAEPHVLKNGSFAAISGRQPDAQSPAGGVSASARDMGRWLAFLIGDGTFEGREIVPASALLPAMRAEIISAPSAVPSARPGFYGYGFGVQVTPSGRTMIQHSGAFLTGASTTFALLPSEKLGIVVLTNAPPVGAVEALAMQFMDYVQFGSLTRDWFANFSELIAPLSKPTGALVGKTPPVQPEPAQKLAAYAGTYLNPYFGTATVSVTGDHLTLGIGPKPIEMPLSHWSGDVFTFVPFPGSTPDGTISQVTFSRKGKRTVDLTVEALDDSGLGTFTRK